MELRIVLLYGDFGVLQFRQSKNLVLAKHCQKGDLKGKPAYILVHVL